MLYASTKRNLKKATMLKKSIMAMPMCKGKKGKSTAGRVKWE